MFECNKHHSNLNAPRWCNHNGVFFLLYAKGNTSVDVFVGGAICPDLLVMSVGQLVGLFPIVLSTRTK